MAFVAEVSSADAKSFPVMRRFALVDDGHDSERQCVAMPCLSEIYSLSIRATTLMSNNRMGEMEEMNAIEDSEMASTKWN